MPWFSSQPFIDDYRVQKLTIWRFSLKIAKAHQQTGIQSETPSLSG